MWVEGSDFAVAPAADDTLSVSGEGDAVALEVWHLDSEQLLTVLGVPDSDVVYGAGGKQVGVVVGEGYVVDSAVMACISKLSVQLVGVDEVDV